jgi:hypothetical protein
MVSSLQDPTQNCHQTSSALQTRTRACEIVAHVSSSIQFNFFFEFDASREVPWPVAAGGLGCCYPALQHLIRVEVDIVSLSTRRPQPMGSGGIVPIRSVDRGRVQD